MKKYIYLLLLLLVSVSFFSCYNYKTIGFLQGDKRPDSMYEPVEYEEYRIRTNDQIIYRLVTTDETIFMLFNQGAAANNSLTYLVYDDGTVRLPFLEPLKVAGLTITEATALVEKQYRDILPDATVKLTLATKTFTVIGDINSGVYPVYKDRLTIFQALSMSGDLNLSADRKKVRIIRETNDGTKIMEFDIRSANIIESDYYYIYPNDIIYVQKDEKSFYKVGNYSSFLSLITSSISLLLSVMTFVKAGN